MSSPMSQASVTPTTTYPFTYTTYSTSLPSSKFSTPTIVPSIFSWGAAASCSANSMSRPQPSNFPIDRPSGLDAACVISNAREVNDHAFWDLYACCKSLRMTASGSPNVCTAQCTAGNGQTWQELGDCLSKRVEVVVCRPAFIEIGRNQTEGSGVSSSVSASQTKSSTSSGVGSASASGSGAQVSGSQSTGAGSAVGVVHVVGSKAGVALFVVLAFGSFAGMML
jgi:hypothetical protein